MPVLLLGGTGEARELAARLHPDTDIISSLAGRVPDPALPVGPVRIGGFGGVDGLREWLRDNDISAVIDATHPFAATMTAHAAQACAELGLPHLVLARPAWDTRDAILVASDTEAAQAVAVRGFARIFLTTGRSGLAPFTSSGAWFLIRVVTRPMRRCCRPITGCCCPADPTVTTTSGRCCATTGSTCWSPRTAGTAHRGQAGRRPRSGCAGGDDRPPAAAARGAGGELGR
jgi:precorrin-6x reductase